MSIEKIDIVRKRGDTYADEFVVSDPDTGLPAPISGYTFFMALDTSPAPVDTTNQVYQLTGTIVNALGGRVEFAPTALQADRIGTFYYDVQMVDALGRKRTIVVGRYKYVQDITKV